MKIFVNRIEELKKLKANQKGAGGLIVIYGRRRVGKTRLIAKWFEESNCKNTAYSQAVEGSLQLQLEQIFEDLKDSLDLVVVPKTWGEFFSILRKSDAPWMICLDEFQYLVLACPSLPSMLQKFIDHQIPKNCLFIISGSSQSMMHRLVTDSSEPLYDRSIFTINLKPMSYRHFCEYMSLNPQKIDSFYLFSLVGGLPRYWKALDQFGILDPVAAADQLYFEAGSLLEDEADRILKDEGTIGNVARSILECIGRGSHRISEIAGRLQQPATNFSRPIKFLVDLGIIVKETPFGVSVRDSKRTLYRLSDPVLEFWYSTYSPFRVRWKMYSSQDKQSALHLHASRVMERVIRDSTPGAQRYWESQFEWDCVFNSTASSIVIREIKLSKLTAHEKRALEKSIKDQFKASELSAKFTLKAVEVFDVHDCLDFLAKL